MGQTRRRIDLIDAENLLLEVVSSCVRLMRSMWSGQRGVASPLEASRAPFGTRAIRRPGGRAEDAIAEETFPTQHRNFGSEH